MSKFLLSAVSSLTVAFASHALADVTTTDGDTIKVDGRPYRLWGIDAPEYKQTCADGWPAGARAFEALSDLVRGRTVVCEHMTADRYGRSVAICRVGAVDLGATMVRNGFAWAFVRYSRDYVGQEQEARAARAGVHAHDCMPAWDWRAVRRGQSE